MGNYGPSLGLLPVAGIVLYLSVLHFCFWRARREDGVHLWVATWFAVSSVFVLARYIQVQQLGPEFIPLLVRLQFTCAAAFLFLGLGLAESLSGRPSNLLLLRAGAGVSLALAALPWTTELVVTNRVFLRDNALDDSYFALRPGPLVLVLGCGSLAVLCYGLRRIAVSPILSRNHRRLLGAGFSLSVLFAINDLLQVAFNLPTVRLYDYGFLAIGVAFSLVIVERSGQIRDRLEREVIARTDELEGRNVELRQALAAQEAARQEASARAQALACSEARFRALIEGVPDALLADRDGTLVYANPRAQAMFCAEVGFGRERSLLDFVHPDERPMVDQLRGVLREGGDPSALQEVRLLTAEGRVVYVEMVAMRIPFDGAPSIVTLLRDTTERRGLQAQLLLADRMASLGTLAAGVAHEVNNPLTLVMNNAQVLIDRARRRGTGWAADDLVEVAEILEEIKLGADRVRHVVKELQTFSQASNEPGVATDLRRPLAASLRMVMNQIRHRAHLVEKIGVTPLVDADDARLGQVFVNLLVNAAQAIPDGHTDEYEIRITAGTLPNGHAFVEIADNGHGIAPQTLPRIFDPFFTTKGVGDGAGLGLSICHTIITALGGTIRLHSELDKGTTVHISLPPAILKRFPAPVTTSSPEPTRKARVLIVDDEPFVARALTRTLGEHTVVSVQSAKDALELLHTQSFDVVFCDLMMPNMTGMDLFEAVRTALPGLEQRFVFMTGGAFTARAREFIEHTENPRLEKPFDPQLVRRITCEAVQACALRSEAS